MRLQLMTALTIILITALVSTSMNFQTRATATNPEAIPDKIAYELFMHSVTDYLSEYVFKDSGLSGDQIANLWPVQIEASSRIET